MGVPHGSPRPTVRHRAPAMFLFPALGLCSSRAVVTRARGSKKRLIKPRGVSKKWVSPAVSFAVALVRARPCWPSIGAAGGVLFWRCPQDFDPSIVGPIVPATQQQAAAAAGAGRTSPPNQCGRAMLALATAAFRRVPGAPPQTFFHDVRRGMGGWRGFLVPKTAIACALRIACRRCWSRGRRDPGCLWPRALTNHRAQNLRRGVSRAGSVNRHRMPCACSASRCLEIFLTYVTVRTVQLLGGRPSATVPNQRVRSARDIIVLARRAATPYVGAHARSASSVASGVHRRSRPLMLWDMHRREKGRHPSHHPAGGPARRHGRNRTRL